MEWINCNDKLPEPDEHVLIWCEVGVCRGYRDNREEYPSWQHYPLGSYAGDGCIFHVTHWMSLPQPPKSDCRNCHGIEEAAANCFSQDGICPLCKRYIRCGCLNSILNKEKMTLLKASDML